MPVFLKQNRTLYRMLDVHKAFLQISPSFQITPGSSNNLRQIFSENLQKVLQTVVRQYKRFAIVIDYEGSINYANESRPGEVKILN